MAHNLLNQYTQRTVPGAIDVRGSAIASAQVLVNGVPATRQDGHFHRAVPVDNDTAPRHPQITVQAFAPGIGLGGADLVTGETSGRAFLPKSPEAFAYDLDGNLTEDGRWVYTWDHDNRLVAMESAPSVPATAKRKLEFAYDSRGRRIRKRVHDWDGAAYVLAGERRYAYDGWNLAAEAVAAPTPFVRTYVWGLDLSGSEQGAGGVGGLLAIQENGESHYPAYDGNGNVMALVRRSDGAVSGRYEYGPFGELLEVEEDGIANPFRFSTKFQDEETGLLYYGFRYYDPVTGRWLSRDPIEEEGGVNLYGFVGNDGINGWDYLGLRGPIVRPPPVRPRPPRSGNPQRPVRPAPPRQPHQPPYPLPQLDPTDTGPKMEATWDPLDEDICKKLKGSVDKYKKENQSMGQNNKGPIELCVATPSKSGCKLLRMSMGIAFHISKEIVTGIQGVRVNPTQIGEGLTKGELANSLDNTRI